MIIELISMAIIIYCVTNYRKIYNKFVSNKKDNYIEWVDKVGTKVKNQWGK